MATKRLDINAVLGKSSLNSFAAADKKEEEHKILKEIVLNDNKGKSGRPVRGKSKATNKIAFVVDDEQLAYLKSLINYDNKILSPNAAAKKLFLAAYEIHKDT